MSVNFIEDDTSEDDHKLNIRPAVDNKSLNGDSDDDLDFSLDQQDNAVWLVKVPNFLAQKWMQIGFTHAGHDLGQVRIDKASTQGNNPKVTLHIPDEPWSMDLPKNYNLKFTNLAPKNEYVFTETSQGRAVSIAGIVQHEAIVSPMVDDDSHAAYYQRIMKKRTATASAPNRVVKMMDDTKVEHRRLMGSASSDTWNSGLDLLKKKTAKSLDKRERMTRNELLNMLFPLFSGYPYWNFKGLVEQTRQPHAWLKEILSDVCILNKRGPYTGMYQLKPEFVLGGHKALASSGNGNPGASSSKS